MARTPGQSFVGLELSDELLALLDEARRTRGLSRSQYIRFAITSALESGGVAFAADLAYAPDRTGKGGRPSHRKPRSDSKLRNLPPDVYAELVRMFVDGGAGYEVVKEWLEKKHGVKVSVGALGDFWQSDVQAYFKQSREKALEAASAGQSSAHSKSHKPNPRTSSSSPADSKRKDKAA